MSGHRIFVDTNILIMLIDGNEKIADLLKGNQLFISFITELELLSAHGLNSQQILTITEMISSCNVIDINPVIKSRTIQLRQENKVKLPDAIIAATAIAFDLPLFTADKGFKTIEGLSLILFEN